MFGVTEYRIDLASRVLAGPTSLTVIMPAPDDGESVADFYRSGKKYKVIWLLHAGMGDNNDWLRYTNICRYIQGKDIVLVMPNGLQSDYANHPEFADGYNFKDFFFEELMPFIYNWFPVSEAPEDNFLCGYSMGSSGAVMLALEHPERFAAVCGYGVKNYSYLEPYRNMRSEEFRSWVKAHPKKIPAGYGPSEDGIRPKEVNMIAKYPTVGAFLDSYEHTLYRYQEAAAKGKLPRFYVPYSSKEPKNSHSMLWFRRVADEISLDTVTFAEIPGDYVAFGFCDAFIPGMLNFFGLDGK